jgi:hypothetical protein
MQDLLPSLLRGKSRGVHQNLGRLGRLVGDACTWQSADLSFLCPSPEAFGVSGAAYLWGTDQVRLCESANAGARSLAVGSARSSSGDQDIDSIIGEESSEKNDHLVKPVSLLTGIGWIGGQFFSELIGVEKLYRYAAF